MKLKLILLACLFLLPFGARADMAMVDNGRYVCPLNADVDFIVAGAAFNCNASPTVLLAAAMGGGGVLPAPMRITVDPTALTGVGVTFFQYYTFLGTDWRGNVLMEVLQWTNNEAATPKTTVGFYRTILNITYTSAGAGVTDAGLTDVGYAAATQFIIPLRTTQFDMDVDTSQIGLWTDLTANPPTSLTAAYGFPSQTIITGWIYKPGGYLYFAPKAAPAAADVIRFQCWRY